jgi:hypothetical protein
MISVNEFYSIDKDTSDRSIKNTAVRDMLNLIPVNNGASDSGERQNILGNIAATKSGFTGSGYSSKGVITDEQTSLVYLFCTATISSVSNSVLLEYNPESNTLNQILARPEGIFLKTGVDFVQGFVESDWIYYNDGGGLKRFSITKAKAGDYASSLANVFDLYLTAPLDAPTCVKSYDSNIEINNIGQDTWSFAYRYVYSDGAKSVLSPISIPVLANQNPFDNSASNKITVTYAVDSSVQSLLDSVEVYFVANSDGTYRLLDKNESPTVGNNTAVFTSPINGLALSQAESLKPYENISTQPKSLAYPENRAVCVKGISEYDVSGTYDIALSVVYETANTNSLYLKEGGKYDVGIVLIDEKGRQSPVLRKKTIEVPYADNTTSTGSNFYLPNSRPKLRVTFSGQAPSWATKAYVVISDEQVYENYIQVPAHLLFYSTPLSNAAGFNEGSDPVFMTLDSNIYAFDKTDMTSRLDTGELVYTSTSDTFLGYTAIDLQIPKNMPALPEVGWRVRLMFKNEGGVQGDLRVSQVNTNSIRIEGYTTDDWSSVDSQLYVEIYKTKESPVNTFYETGISVGISSGSFASTTVDVNGDTFYADMSTSTTKASYNALDNKDRLSNTYTDSLAEDVPFRCESPTPTMADNLFVALDNESLTNAQGFAVSEGKKSFSLDYSKRYIKRGRLNIENSEYGQKDYASVLIASNSFVENTKINGLNRFDFEDEFPLPNERTPITHLEVVNNVLLALHERNTTSVYIGEKFLKQSSGQDTITTTDSFFGDERLLIGDYGTINPESVKTHLGQCFWWDANRGAVIRYAGNGLTEISNVGLKDYFRSKGETYTSGYKVFGAIDTFLNLYVLTFPAQDGLSAETWAFDINKSVWLGRFSYEFEMALQLGNNFATFKSDNIWKHHSGSVYNNFYGTQYDSRVTFVSNPDVAVDKSFDSISLDSDSAWDVLAITNELGQNTDLIESEFELDDNQYYSELKRDKNTPSDLLNGKPALLEGSPIQSKNVEVTLRKSGSTLQKINAVYLGYSLLSGHLLQAR